MLIYTMKKRIISIFTILLLSLMFVFTFTPVHAGQIDVTGEGSFEPTRKMMEATDLNFIELYGGLGFNGALDQTITGQYTITERTTFPAYPSAGNFVIWMNAITGDGSASAGDIVVRITSGDGSQLQSTIVDFRQ